MSDEHRKSKRFLKIGRVTAQAICVFQGVILDISLKGCRVRFPAVIKPDLENDYELCLSFSEKMAPDLLMLLGHIQWLECDSDSTEIGFMFLHSPDSKKLTDFIEKLILEQQERL